MKPFAVLPSPATFPVALAVAAGLLLAGCTAKPSGGGGDGAEAPPVTPARPTSFAEVTQQLDPGGSLYGYLATDQWLAGLSTKLNRWRDLILALPDVSPEDARGINLAFDLLTKGIARSGLENISGVGVSGMQVSPELHRAKLVLHHGTGNGGGLIWDLLGRTPHPLPGVDLLTTNTAFAAFGDLDVAVLWQALAQGLGGAGVPELSQGVQKWPAEFEKQTGLVWPELLASLGGEAGLVVTLDPAHRISIPIGAAGAEIPTPGALFVLKVKNDLLFDRLAAEFKKQERVRFTEAGGVKMYALPLPVPLPLDLQVTLARSGDLLLLASTPALVQEALAVRAGATPGLKQTGEFQALQKFLPATGNQLTYVGRRFSESLIDMQRQVLGAENKMPSGQKELLEKLFFAQKPTYGMTIGTHTPSGWQTISVANHDASASLLLAPVAGVAMGSAMLLPALAQAKTKAQSVSCMNNLKQISLGLRLWAVDHNDQFPFNVSTAEGGTRELCERDATGYDQAAAHHLKALAAQLNTTKILVCPGDKSKQVADDFSHLEGWNVSYQLRTGPQVSDANPGEIVLYCPIHRHRALVDGSVRPDTSK